MSKPLGAAVAALGGVMLAAQARINGRLAHLIGDGIVAALVSFSVGVVILSCAVAAMPTARAGFRKLANSDLRVWHCLGGLAGAWYVASQGLTVTALGVAVFTVAVVAGQVVSSLVVDRAGLGPGEPQLITPTRAVGAALAVVAVGVAVSDRFGGSTQLWLALLPALAGVGLGWQQAMNGQVRMVSGSVGFASLLNFAVGGAGLLVAGAVDIAVRGLPGPLPGDWWLYVGGALGVIGISTAVYAVRHIGVLMVGLFAVAGQLVGALLLDAVEGGVHPVTAIGVVIMLAAVGIAAVPRRG